MAYIAGDIESAYTANNTLFSRYDWIFDSGTTSSIATMREAFTNYEPLTNATVKGISNSPAKALGCGSVVVNFSVNGQTIRHQLKDVLHVPEAPNCLLSSTRFDESGGSSETKMEDSLYGISPGKSWA